MEAKFEVPAEVIAIVAVAIVAVAIVAVVGFVMFVAAILAWGVGDSQKRGQSGFLFLILFGLLGPLAVLVWLLVRPAKSLVQRPHEIYFCADEALAAASSLEQLGEWDHAISLHENTAHRWPEHREYISECRKRIKEKQVTA